MRIDLHEIPNNEVCVLHDKECGGSGLNLLEDAGVVEDGKILHEVLHPTVDLEAEVPWIATRAKLP